MLDFILLFLELSLMVLFFNRVALSVVGMSAPHLEANPTKVVSTSASHVNTPSILINMSLAHGTLLSNYLVQPLLVFVVDYLVPGLEISTVQRIVIALSTYSANTVAT